MPKMSNRSYRRPLAEIDAIIAFRHVGPFPEWARFHPRHKDVLLCPDCLEDRRHGRSDLR